MSYQIRPYYEKLKILDKILTSGNPTVEDMLNQTLVLAEVSNEEEEKTDYVGHQAGPIEQLINDITNLQSRLQNLEMQINNMVMNRQYTTTGYPTTSPGTISYPGAVWTGGTSSAAGTYWGPTTSDHTYGGTGYSYNVTYPSVSETLSDITLGGYKSTAVTEALKSDPDSWDLIDPDTGDTMTVKYK